MSQSDEEDDYMNMVFEDVPKQPAYETSLQRAARKRKEGEAKARPKSKAEREAEAEAAREAALATALPENNKGFKMMAKFGFKQGDTLGKSENARKEPIQVSIKADKGGIGVESEKKRKLREAWDEAARAAKRSKEDEGDYIEDRRQQEKERKMERDLNSAQKTAERLTEQEEEQEGKDTKGTEEKPLKDINVLWRVRARRRVEKEHDRRKRRELDNSLASRLPTLARDEDEEDIDSKVALGRDAAPFYTSLEDDLEGEDPELAEFEALPLAERLEKVLVFLRNKYKYCLYCGYQYPDAVMEGCPGITEEDHD